MKMRTGLWASLLLLAAIQGCDSNQGLLDDDRDTRPLNPTPPKTVDSSTPAPPASAPVLTTNDNEVLLPDGQVLMVRGANLDYTSGEVERIQGVDALKSVGSNVVRILVDKTTTVDQLESILDRAVEQDVVAMLVFTGPEGEIACTREKTYVTEAVEDYWLDQWMPVLSQAKYQPHLMINIAHKWGPETVFSAAASISYEDYVEAYKYFIQQFRAAGFRVPLVIDAPGCGMDHLAFMGGRARALLAADDQENIVLSVHAFGVGWNSQQEIQSNISDLQRLPVPFVVTEFGGSGVDDTSSLDHNVFLEEGAGNKALVLDLPWVQPDDMASYVYELGEPVNVLEKNLRMDVYLPHMYVNEGQLTLQMYVRDMDGNVALFPQTSAATKVRDRWNRLSSTAYQLSDFAETQDGFTGENVTHVGVKISANGKAADIEGPIMVDNIVLGGEVEPYYHATFDFDTQGWARRWGAPVSGGLGVYYEDGVLNVWPDWEAGSQGCGGGSCVVVAYEQAHLLEPAIDLSEGFVLTFDVLIPEEYQDPEADGEAIVLQPFFTDNTANNVYADMAWIPATSGRFTFGEWSQIRVQMDDFAAYLANSTSETDDNFDLLAGPARIGLQINNVTEPKDSAIKIDNIKIERLAPVGAGQTTVYETSFESGTDGWYDNENVGAGYGSITVGSQDGMLSALPNNTEGIGKLSAQYNFSFAEAQGINFDYPVTFRYRFFVPESYQDALPVIHLYMNGSGGETPESGWNNWSGFLGVDFNNRYVAGQWFEGSRTYTSFSQFNEGQVVDYNPDNPPKAIGFEVLYLTTTKDEPILFDYVSVEVQYPLGTETIVMDFDQPGQEPLPLDQTEGFIRPEWNAVMGPNVATIDFGVEPFGWLAWSWFGAEDGWDMSEFPGFIDPSDPESGVSLTERGDEIVYGTYGIMQSTSPAPM